MLGVLPSAVRYWKGHFAPHVRPSRTRGDQVSFSRRDVTVLALVRHLLHVEGLSIIRARARIERLLSEHDGKVDFIELSPTDAPASGPGAASGPEAAPGPGGTPCPVEPPAGEGFLAERERLRAGIAEVERRAADAEAEIERLRAVMARARLVAAAMADL
ncbi:MAG: MerR family transcriptional regulator [Deltaproteobacteria bacterium]|nr:MerR family transcriptional regulator [Deltaproteobacteria bacterium]